MVTLDMSGGTGTNDTALNTTTALRAGENGSTLSLLSNIDYNREMKVEMTNW